MPKKTSKDKAMTKRQLLLNVAIDILNINEGEEFDTTEILNSGRYEDAIKRHYADLYDKSWYEDDDGEENPNFDEEGEDALHCEIVHDAIVLLTKLRGDKD